MEPATWCRDLTRTLLGYRRSDYLSDAVLRCRDGVAVPAHRIVLGRASTRLAAWLKEVADQEVTVIIIPDMDSRVASFMVEALYEEGSLAGHEEGGTVHSGFQKQNLGGFDWLMRDLGLEVLQKIQSERAISIEKPNASVSNEEHRGERDTEDVVDQGNVHLEEIDIDPQVFLSSDQDVTNDLQNLKIELNIHTTEITTEQICNVNVETGEKVDKEKFKPSTLDVCPLCSLNKSEHINRDIEILEAGKELFKCCFCEWSRLSSTNFIAHVENHIEKKFTCDICFKGFSHKQTMVKHKNIHQKGEVPLYTCDQDGCIYASERKDAVTAHKKRVHLKLKDLEAKVTCPKCAKEMNKKFFLNYHSKTCSGRTILQCDICGKSGFVNKTTLANHVKSIHSQLKLFNCEHCTSRFSTAMNLSTHRKRMHSVNKQGRVLNTKFHCDQCGKVLTSNQKLKKHVMVVHEKKLNFACAYCSKTFSSNSNMMTHEGRVHTGILPYKCDQCDKTFSRKNLLEKHVEAIHVTGDLIS